MIVCAVSAMQIFRASSCLRELEPVFSNSANQFSTSRWSALSSAIASAPAPFEDREPPRAVRLRDDFRPRAFVLDDVAMESSLMSYGVTLHVLCHAHGAGQTRSAQA